MSTNDFHKLTTIKAEKKGEFIRLKINGPVYVRGDYCKELKKFSLYKFDDVNHEIFKRGDFPVYSGFDF